VIFKPMDPEEVLKLLEGHENILTPAVEENERFFRTLSCPSCGGAVVPFVDPSRPLFREGEFLPNYMARCRECGTEFEPYTGIQVSL
jgi:hypothetical protein